MADIPYDPKVHGPLVTDVPYDPAVHGPLVGDTSLDRGAALATQGTTHGILNVLGAPVDFVTSLLNTPMGGGAAARAGGAQRGAGIQDPIGGSASLKNAADWLSTVPAKLGLSDNQGGTLTPAGPGEKALYGGGEAVGGAVGTMLPGFAMARMAAPGSMAQALGQALTTQPVMQGVAAGTGGAVSGATDNPALGLAAALAVPTGAGLAARAVSPMGPARTAAETERRRLVDVLRGEDIPLTTGQITGNRGVQALESVLETLPISGGMQRRLVDRQREGFNRAVTGTTGEPIDAFTVAERGARRADLGTEFERLAQNTTVNLDQQFTTQLNDILTRYRQQLPPDVYRNVEQRLEALVNASTTPGNPQIPGPIYQTLRSKLSAQATSTGDNEVRTALREARNALDEAARRSMPADQAAEWDAVRRQYGNLRTIDNSMRGADAAVGDIPPRGLAAQVNMSNRRGGAQDLTDISNAGTRILADQLGQSGTQPRTFWQNLVTGGGLAGGGFALSGGNPAVAAASVAGPPIAQLLLENPATRAWAGNRLLGNVPTLPSGALAGDLALNAATQQDTAAQRRMLAQLLMRANEQRAR